MRKIDFSKVEPMQDGGKQLIPAGGYVAAIMSVDDFEDREYLKIGWDFVEGALRGKNTEVYNKFGYYPMSFVRSYKAKALGFFKGFIMAVEESNRNYRGFDCSDTEGSLLSKYVGIVLGVEEYLKKDGTIGERNYVAQVRSVQAIRNNDFTVPELKKYVPKNNSAYAQTAPVQANVPSWNDFQPIRNDEELPF